MAKFTIQLTVSDGRGRGITQKEVVIEMDGRTTAQSLPTNMRIWLASQGKLLRYSN